MRGLTDQQNLTSASLKAARVLSRHNRPFTDTEVSKEVAVTVWEELATGKSMDGIISFRETGVVISGLSRTNYFPLDIDENTDNTDLAQMCVCVRYFDGKGFSEELLSLIPD